MKFEVYEILTESNSTESKKMLAVFDKNSLIRGRVLKF